MEHTENNMTLAFSSKDEAVALAPGGTQETFKSHYVSLVVLMNQCMNICLLMRSQTCESVCSVKRHPGARPCVWGRPTHQSFQDRCWTCIFPTVADAPVLDAPSDFGRSSRPQLTTLHPGIAGPSGREHALQHAQIQSLRN